MQDRICRIDEYLLQRTAGPYIGSRAEELKVSTTSPLYPEKQTLARAAGMSH
jgi:hypothetical protein